MRQVLYLIFSLSLSLGGCLPVMQRPPEADQQTLDWQPEGVLTLAQAERILGEPGKLSNSRSYLQQDVRIYTSEYTALASDASGRTGKLYFMLEVYPDQAAAQKSYASIYDSNREHEGIEVLSQVGDQAYWHSDKANFQFLLVRKNHQLLRFKVNRLTAKTSEPALRELARSLSDAL